MKRFFITIAAGVLWGLACSFTVSFGQTETTDFGVDGYIPEYFRDFEWRVFGGAYVNGDDREQERSGVSPAFSDESNLYAMDMQSLNLGSLMRYRYATVPRFATFVLESDIGFSHTNRLFSRRVDDPDNFSDFNHDDQSDISYDIALSPSLDVGQYVAGDLFLSSLINLSMQTRGLFDGADADGEIRADVVGVDSFRINVLQAATEKTTDYRMYDVDIRLMPGWGRVYDGKFAAAALYMVDELRREGLLNREPAATEMRELCDLIYQYRLVHRIDKRLHKIEALQNIAEYFTERNIIADPGPYGYLLIQDVWDYFPHDSRLFGLRVRMGPGIEYGLSRDRRSDDNSYYRTMYDSTASVVDTIDISSGREVRYVSSEIEHRHTYLELAAEYHRPIDLRWQLDVSAFARYYPDAYSVRRSHHRRYRDGGLSFDMFENYYTQFNAFHRINALGKLRYIFNSRTSSSVSITYDRNHFNSSIQSNFISETGGPPPIRPLERENREANMISIGGSLVYRIAIPTELTVQASYNIISYETEREVTATGDDHSYSLSVMLAHYLY